MQFLALIVFACITFRGAYMLTISINV